MEPGESSRGRIRCGLCGATWNADYAPVSSCPGIMNYGWWDNVPDHLKTKTALAREGLKPGGPAKGCVPRRRRDEYYYLFDEREAVAKRKPSASQLEALARGRSTAEKNSTCSRCGRRATRPGGNGRRAFRVRVAPSLADPEKLLCQHCRAIERWEARDRPEAIAWARSLVEDPEGFVVFDSETTGLGDADFVEVAVVRGDGEVLIHSLVKPLLEVEQSARAVHGIEDAQLEDAPPFPEIYPRLSEILKGSGMRVVAYNSSFDRGVWEATLARHGLKPRSVEGEEVDRSLDDPWECAMEFYAAYVGEFYGPHAREYRYQRLDEAGGNHGALGDARAALALIRKMAGAR